MLFATCQTGCEFASEFANVLGGNVGMNPGVPLKETIGDGLSGSFHVSFPAAPCLSHSHSIRGPEVCGHQLHRVPHLLAGLRGGCGGQLCVLPHGTGARPGVARGTRWALNCVLVDPLFSAGEWFFTRMPLAQRKVCCVAACSPVAWTGNQAATDS